MGEVRGLSRLVDCPPSLLRTFVTFADKQSVTHTASELRIDQALASRHLQLFEKVRIHGEPLLLRPSKRRLQITERGKQVADRIQEVLSRYDELLEHLRGRASAPEVVRLAVGTFSAQLFLPSVVADARNHDRWDVKTFIERGEDRIEGVAKSQFDVALVTHDSDDIGTTSATKENLTTTKLASFPLVILVPKSKKYRPFRSLPKEKTVTVEQLADWPLVGFDERAGLVQKLNRHLSGERTVQLETSTHPGGWAMGREYARYGLGFALLPTPLLTHEDKSTFAVRRLVSTFSVEVYAIRRKTKPTPAQSEVWSLLVDTARAMASGQC